MHKQSEKWKIYSFFLWWQDVKYAKTKSKRDMNVEIQIVLAIDVTAFDGLNAFLLVCESQIKGENE